jgi:hypothetical protein
MRAIDRKKNCDIILEMKKEQFLKELDEMITLLKEEEGDKFDEVLKRYEKTMGFFSMFYVLNSEYNTIKFTRELSWNSDKGILVEWNNDYTFCRLIYNDGNKDIDKQIRKEDILSLIKIIEEIDFFNIDDKEIIQLDGGSCEFEININEKYNYIEDYFYNNGTGNEKLNKILYSLLKLINIELKEITFYKNI